MITPRLRELLERKACTLARMIFRLVRRAKSSDPTVLLENRRTAWTRRSAPLTRELITSGSDRSLQRRQNLIILPIGFQDIRAVHDAVRIPIFCIGGIKLGNLPEVIAAGARRVVIVSGLLQAPDVASYARSAKNLLTKT